MRKSILLIAAILSIAVMTTGCPLNPLIGNDRGTLGDLFTTTSSVNPPFEYSNALSPKWIKFRESLLDPATRPYAIELLFARGGTVAQSTRGQWGQKLKDPACFRIAYRASLWMVADINNLETTAKMQNKGANFVIDRILGPTKKLPSPYGSEYVKLVKKTIDEATKVGFAIGIQGMVDDYAGSVRIDCKF